MLFVVLGAVAIGLVLGLLGSGGSILTVPILVYLAHEPDKVAIAESLAIVGGIALFGALPYARQKLVDWYSVLYFGVPAILGTYLGAVLARWVPGTVQLTLFAVVMIVAAVMMFRGRPSPPEAEGAPERQALWMIGSEGLVVGVLTGLVGVGGGFLIVPALVLLGGLSMRLAVGTSLLIISAKSAAGFWKYTDVLAEVGQQVDWPLIGLFTAIGIVGSFVGNAFSHRVPQARLKRVFAVFLIVMGGVILAREGPKALRGADADPPPSGAVRTVEPLTSAPRIMSLLSRIFRRSPPVRLAPAAFVAEGDPTAPVLDVRTRGEYAAGHLAGAIHVDLASADFVERLEALADDGTLAPDRPVYLYCRSGARSGRATRMLRSMGYAEAWNVGGLRALRAAGARVEE